MVMLFCYMQRDFLLAEQTFVMNPSVHFHQVFGAFADMLLRSKTRLHAS